MPFPMKQWCFKAKLLAHHQSLAWESALPSSPFPRLTVEVCSEGTYSGNAIARDLNSL